MTKIKINKLNDMFWYYPSIFTASKKGWYSRPYRKAKELFEANDLNHDLIISINPSGYYDLFSYSQTYWKYNFQPSLKQIENFLKNDDEQILSIDEMKDYSIKIYWTKKAIKKIAKGNIPFISPKTLSSDFINNNITDAKLEWNGKRFDWYKSV
ncbi:MAG: hypothetical protein RSA87_03630 [Malacoplasma sp.]